MPKVLIADDSPTERRLFQRALARLPVEVLLAGDGDEAERIIHEARPDLLVLDVVMPGKNGFALCRELKADPAFATMPILIVTSKDQDADIFWGQRQGADEYLVKPFSPQDLADAVKRHLGLDGAASPGDDAV
ncbi:MAG: response regulator [Deltaproteobacteria bacterium]|nr:MAG: response regulator [Deltaproteobacteria bacterium]